jgi:hypothetical protein
MPLKEHAEKVRNRYHKKRLEGMEIGYFLIDAAVREKKVERFGKTHCPNPTEAALYESAYGARPDFFIKVPHDNWKRADKAKRDAGLDHLLSYCVDFAEKGQTKRPGIQGPDIGEFWTVAKRHGAWNPELRHLVNTLKQLNLFTDPDEEETNVKQFPKAASEGKHACEYPKEKTRRKVACRQKVSGGPFNGSWYCKGHRPEPRESAAK